jgi:hypothetical protein
MRRNQDDGEPAAGRQPEEKCPFHHGRGTVSKPDFETWRDTEVRCSAGKREFQLGRYCVEHVRNGYQFNKALDRFRSGVEAHEKTGFLAIVPSLATDFSDSLGELRRLGEIMVEAGFAESAGALIHGETIAIPFEVRCPVTGFDTIYEFFPVAFCRHAATLTDPLYDPSLSSPFLAINTTSDAFAFGMLVKDLSERHFHCAPFEIGKRSEFERLLHKCAVAWQNMSANTIQSYNRVSAVPQRAVALLDDHRWWTAPHNDPVFAETEKLTHSHEMPVIYAQRLCRKWIAALYEDAELAPSRDGQSGGIYLAAEDLAAEDLAAAFQP